MRIITYYSKINKMETLHTGFGERQKNEESVYE